MTMRLSRLLPSTNDRCVTLVLVVITIFGFIVTQKISNAPVFDMHCDHAAMGKDRQESIARDYTVARSGNIASSENIARGNNIAREDNIARVNNIAHEENIATRDNIANHDNIVHAKPSSETSTTRGTLTSIHNEPSTKPDTKLKYHELDVSIDRDLALLAGSHRNTRGHLTIGIPTIHREKGSYLVDTVTSLVLHMNASERQTTTIIILLADFEVGLKKTCLREIRREFREFINAGLIQVIHAPRAFYPSLDGLKRAYNDPESKVKWRSKQNYDYAFLLKYSVNISEYYLQLEDDVVTINNYMTIITDFITSQKNNWICLEFSELGYIGKLYRSTNLDQLAKMLMLFYQDQPPDFTFIYFNILLTQFQRIIRLPTIFQHMGYNSSLNGKVQTLKDRYFDDFSKQFDTADNPPASIYTNFTAYEPYKPQYAYNKLQDNYFWVEYPQEYMYLLLIFDRPAKVNRVVITTGSSGHPDDYLREGTLEISPILVNKMENSAECANWLTVGNFTSGMVDVRNVGDLMKFDVFCVRVTMVRHQVPWIIFREIAVFIEEN